MNHMDLSTTLRMDMSRLLIVYGCRIHIRSVGMQIAARLDQSACRSLPDVQGLPLSRTVSLA